MKMNFYLMLISENFQIFQMKKKYYFSLFQVLESLKLIENLWIMLK